jgi:hypothetical protein
MSIKLIYFCRHGLRAMRQRVRIFVRFAEFRHVNGGQARNPRRRPDPIPPRPSLYQQFSCDLGTKSPSGGSVLLLFRAAELGPHDEQSFRGALAVRACPGERDGAQSARLLVNWIAASI